MPIQMHLYLPPPYKVQKSQTKKIKNLKLKFATQETSRTFNLYFFTVCHLKAICNYLKL